MKTFRVTLKLTTNITGCYSDNDSDYEEDIYLDEYMMGCDGGDVPRYIEYAKSLEDTISSVYTEVTFKDITYYNGTINDYGTITFTFTVPDKVESYSSDEITKNDVKEWLEDNSLEDGEFEGYPGSAFIYPCKYDPDRDSEYDDEELALIDYREGITVEEIDNE